MMPNEKCIVEQDILDVVFFGLYDWKVDIYQYHDENKWLASW